MVGQGKPDVLFDALLQKPAGGKLGFSVIPVTVHGSTGLFVKSLQCGGAIDVHNRTCDSDKVIRPGDCIVRAGDAVLDAHRIMEALAQSEEIELSVLRQVSLAHPSYHAELQCLAVSEESMPADLHEYLSEVSAVAAASGFSSVASTAAPALQTHFASAPASQISEAALPSTAHFHSAPPPPPGLPLTGKLETYALGASAAAWLNRASACSAPMASTAGHAELQKFLTPQGKAKAKAEKKNGKAKADIARGTKLTTIALRQLPSIFSRDMLVELLNEVGFAGLYDFVYLPMNLRTGMPFTYAFVNLVTPEAAEACRVALDGYSGCASEYQPVCIVSWADSEQGLEANLERYRNSPVMHESVPDACKPALFRDGLRVAFPPPTKVLKAPPARKSLPACKDDVSKPCRKGSDTSEEAQAEKPCDVGKILSGRSTASTASSPTTDYREAVLRALGMRPPPGLESEMVFVQRLSF